MMSFKPSSAPVRNQEQRLLHMVADLIGFKLHADTVTIGEPFDCLVMRMVQGPELALDALERLDCPTASVLSKRTFSMDGGFGTDKRVTYATV